MHRVEEHSDSETPDRLHLNDTQHLITLKQLSTSGRKGEFSTTHVIMHGEHFNENQTTTLLDNMKEFCFTIGFIIKSMKRFNVLTFLDLFFVNRPKKLFHNEKS